MAKRQCVALHFPQLSIQWTNGKSEDKLHIVGPGEQGYFIVRRVARLNPTFNDDYKIW